MAFGFRRLRGRSHITICLGPGWGGSGGFLITLFQPGVADGDVDRDRHAANELARRVDHLMLQNFGALFGLGLGGLDDDLVVNTVDHAGVVGLERVIDQGQRPLDDVGRRVVDNQAICHKLSGLAIDDIKHVHPLIRDFYGLYFRRPPVDFFERLGDWMNRLYLTLLRRIDKADLPGKNWSIPFQHADMYSIGAEVDSTADAE